MNKILPIIALLTCLFLQVGYATPTNAQTIEDERVYKLKAAFILNFARFTAWPEATLAQNEEFSLCIFGENPFGDAFAGVENKQIASKPIKVMQTDDPNKALQCNLVFISESERDRLEEILANLSGQPLLLVSDIDDFAELGGTIELSTIDQRLGFIINNSKAKEVELKINSSLLDLASDVF